jgi:tryptophan synthase beta chain
LRWNLPTTEMPTAWFNVVPHMEAPPEPPLHPGTRQPVGPDDLAPLFPMALIGQEVTTEPYVDIPGEVLDVLGLWRPTPLVRARHSRTHLLQGRVRLTCRVPQAEHGGPASLL